MGNLEAIHTGTSILYDWDILGSSIYIVDTLRIDDLRIDDQSSMLRSSIYTVTKIFIFLKRAVSPTPIATSTANCKSGIKIPPEREEMRNEATFPATSEFANI